MLTSLILLSACIGILLQLLYKKRRGDFGIFYKLGVAGPTPHWLFGNYLEIKGKQYHQQLQTWTKKYGKIYGYYEGSTPILVVSDINIIRNVYVKQFSHFHARKPLPLGPDPCGKEDVNMFLACGTRWKRLRTIINPTFCTKNLSRMAPAMNSQIEKMLTNLTNDLLPSDGVFNMQDYYHSLTLNTLLLTGFGRDTPASRDDNTILRACQELFLTIQRQSFLQHLSVCLPEIRQYLRVVTLPLARIMLWSMAVLQKHLSTVVQQRRQHPNEKAEKDLLQLMLDAEATADDIQDVDIWQKHPIKGDCYSYRTMTRNADLLSRHRGSNYSSTRKLTDGEIEKQASMFLLAGYDTTSTALSFITYLLATHPVQQRHLLNEIDSNFTCDEIPTADSVKNLPYLDNVIKETLRLYAPATGVTNRECVEECDVGRGLVISPGMVVQVDVWSVHRDPQLWGPVDPDSFEPDRFLKSRDPLAYLPFGAGPRNCIGRRYALLQTKLTLVRLLQVYRLETCAATRRLLRLRSSGPLAIQSRDGVTVRLIKRDH